MREVITGELLDSIDARSIIFGLHEVQMTGEEIRGI